MLAQATVCRRPERSATLLRTAQLAQVAGISADELGCSSARLAELLLLMAEPLLGAFRGQTKFGPVERPEPPEPNSSATDSQQRPAISDANRFRPPDAAVQAGSPTRLFDQALSRSPEPP